MFQTYLELGFDHISDLKGYDHILFIVALCAAFTLGEWKQILILVTAFTIGHSVTLALASLDIIRLPAQLIEVLIPITILVTAVLNVYKKPAPTHSWKTSYFLPLFFGLIHGMGFSNFFKSLLGREADILVPLFAFNIGVEIGQIGIVAVFLLLSFIVLRFLKISQRPWVITISSVAIILSIYMIYDRIAAG